MNESRIDYGSFFQYIFTLSIIACLVLAYWPVFHKMSIRWSAGDNSYCYLIVPLFLYLCWDRREAVRGDRADCERFADRGQRLEVGGKDCKQHPQTSDLKPNAAESVTPQSTGGFRFGEFSWSVWGLVPVVLSVLLIIIGELGSVETLLYTGIWGCIVGLTVVLYGWRVRYLLFPLLILAFIVPLPPFINRMLTFQLKLAASTLSTVMLRVSGVSVLQEGNIIDLGVSQLQMVDACSGLRYLMPLFLMALLVGYFFNKRLWQRAILILVVVPLSIFVNSIRIWITGLLTVKGHEELAQSFFHNFSGWLIFMIAGGVLVTAAFILRKVGERYADGGGRYADGGKRLEVGGEEKNGLGKRLEAEGALPQTSDLKPQTAEGALPQTSNLMPPKALCLKPYANQLGGWLKPMLITAVLCFLFAGSGWALKRIPSAKNLPQRMSFASFPMQIGQWQGNRHIISKEILKELWTDDYVSATYTRPGSANYISLLIPFYEYQGTRHTAHAPQACMLGGGWALFNSGERLINVTPGDDIKIMTMTWEKGNYKLLGSYFFLQRGRVITSPWMNKFYLMWDAFTKRRTDGALVRVELAVAPGQSMEDAYGMLEEFIGKLWPILPDYIPR